MDFPNSLSCHFSISPIASVRSSRLHPVSVQSCYRKVQVGSPTFAHLCDRVYRRMLLMSQSLSLQQCPACSVHLIWMVLQMGGWWPYSCCFVGCCFQDLFNIAHSILVQFLSSFFSICLVSIYVVHPYSKIDITTAWKKLHFILSDRFDFHMIQKLLIAVHAFSNHALISFSVDETQLPR